MGFGSLLESLWLSRGWTCAFSATFGRDLAIYRTLWAFSSKSEASWGPKSTNWHSIKCWLRQVPSKVVQGVQVPKEKREGQGEGKRGSLLGSKGLESLWKGPGTGPFFSAWRKLTRLARFLQVKETVLRKSRGPRAPQPNFFLPKRALFRTLKNLKSHHSAPLRTPLEPTWLELDLDLAWKTFPA